MLSRIFALDCLGCILVAISTCLAAAQEAKPSKHDAKAGKQVAATLALDLGDGAKMDFVLVPAGEFLMGSPDSDKDASLDEKPQHRVKISKAFYLGKFNVTRGQFRQFVKGADYQSEPERDGQGGHGYDPDTKRLQGRNPKYSWKNAGFEQTDEHPVVNVTWNDAVAFCGWQSRKTGSKCELPTEAEWEYACRAGTQTKYYNGDDPEGLAKIANVADASFLKVFPENKYAIKADDGYAFTAPVGRYQPNAFGLYDMLGNVWEWCSDHYDAKYYSESPAADPKGPAAGEYHVLRGGSWFRTTKDCRAAYRHSGRPSGRIDAVGFRVVVRPN